MAGGTESSLYSKSKVIKGFYLDKSLETKSLLWDSVMPVDGVSVGRGEVQLMVGWIVYGSKQGNSSQLCPPSKVDSI